MSINKRNVPKFIVLKIVVFIIVFYRINRKRSFFEFRIFQTIVSEMRRLVQLEKEPPRHDWSRAYPEQHGSIDVGYQGQLAEDCRTTGTDHAN